MSRDKNKAHNRSKTAAILFLIFCFLGNGGLKNLNASAEDPFLKLILEELRTYEPGGDDDILLKLRDYVYEKRNDPQGREVCEKALIGFLDSDATATAKMEVCRFLRTIGSERAVSALQRMLLKTETSDIARFSLEKIPGENVDAILLQAMNKSQGLIKLGLISTLGNRRASDSVPALFELTRDSDPEMASAALNALGNIATTESAAGLSKLLANSSGKLKFQTGAALLACADTLRAEGQKSAASEIFENIISSQASLPQRQAATTESAAGSGF